jgi:hypothetical protein
MVNATLLETYWQIGKIIVEDEQNGAAKAEYGKATLKKLSQQLSLEFGKGYDESNLRNMRAFYRAFPIRDTLRHELSWSHYRILSRVDANEKRIFYMKESIDKNLNTRQLQREINSLSFERILEHLPDDEKPKIKNILTRFTNKSFDEVSMAFSAFMFHIDQRKNFETLNFGDRLFRFYLDKRGYKYPNNFKIFPRQLVGPEIKKILKNLMISL